MNEFLKKVALAGQRNNKKVASKATTTPKTKKTTNKAMTPALYQRTTVDRVVARIRLKPKGAIINE